MSRNTAWLREELLRLLREDVEFRYAVAGLLGLDEILRRLDDNTRAIRDLQEQVRNLQEQVKVLQEQVKALQEQVRELQMQICKLQEQVAYVMQKLEEHSRVLEEHSRVLRLHSEILERHDRAIRELVLQVRALGYRYGICTEEAFREAIRYLIEDLLRVYEVRRWIYHYQEGLVHGHPAVIDVDRLVRDREHTLVEYKALADRADVAELYRRTEFCLQLML